MSEQSVANGLQLELKPKKESYSASETPEFEAILKNVSDQEINVCTYMAQHRLLSTLKGGGYEIAQFGKTQRPDLKNSDFKRLAPGQSISFDINPASEPNYHFIYGAHLPPVVDEKMGTNNLPAGNYKFKAHFGDHISFYNAPDGTFSFKRDRVDILAELPKDNLTLNYSDAWRGDLIASCDVTIS